MLRLVAPFCPFDCAILTLIAPSCILLTLLRLLAAVDFTCRPLLRPSLSYCAHASLIAPQSPLLHQSPLLRPSLPYYAPVSLLLPSTSYRPRPGKLPPPRPPRTPPPAAAVSPASLDSSRSRRIEAHPAPPGRPKRRVRARHKEGGGGGCGRPRPHRNAGAGPLGVVGRVWRLVAAVAASCGLLRLLRRILSGSVLCLIPSRSRLTAPYRTSSRTRSQAAHCGSLRLIAARCTSSRMHS